MSNFFEGLYLKVTGAKKGRDYTKEYRVFFARAMTPDDKRVIATLDNEDEAQILCNALQRRDPTYAGKYWIYDPELGRSIDAINAKGQFTTSWRYIHQ